MAVGMGEGPLKGVHNLASFCQNRNLTTHSCMSGNCNRPPIPANSRRRRRLRPSVRMEAIEACSKKPFLLALRAERGRLPTGGLLLSSPFLLNQIAAAFRNLQHIVARKTLGERQLTYTTKIQAHLPARGRGSSSRRIEGSNGKFASRQRSPFIPIHGQ